MTRYIFLLFLPCLLLFNGCSNDDDAQPTMDEYLKGEWRETKVTLKVTDANGALIADHESTTNATYSISNGSLFMSHWPEFYWNYTLEEKSGNTFIHAQYGANFSFQYAITIVSDQEMVWTKEAMQPGPDGVLNHKSVQKLYLVRKQ